MKKKKKGQNEKRVNPMFIMMVLYIVKCGLEGCEVQICVCV